MKELAIKMGVDPKDIIIDNTSNNTFENIDNAMSLLKDEIATIKNITVVTSEAHLLIKYARENKIEDLEIQLINQELEK